MTMLAPKTRRAAALLTALWFGLLLLSCAVLVALIIILQATPAQMFSLLVAQIIFALLIFHLLPTPPAESAADVSDTAGSLQ